MYESRIILNLDACLYTKMQLAPGVLTASQFGGWCSKTPSSRLPNFKPVRLISFIDFLKSSDSFLVNSLESHSAKLPTPNLLENILEKIRILQVRSLYGGRYHI